MSATATELVKVEREGAVGILTLNRPEALNALNHPLMDQLEKALDEFEKDDEIRAVVIAGSAKAFAAGADIKEMLGRTARQMEEDRHLTRWDKIGRAKKPIVAAVSGFALGGGCELALACDMIVASESAVFGQPEVLIGVIPGAGGTVRLAHAIGKARAMELVLTGRRFTAQEAHAWGLVNRVVPVESCLEEAKKLAAELAKNAPLAVRAGKESVRQAVDLPVDQALETERHLFTKLFETKDQEEGMKAFVEKRKPVWTGK